MFTGKLDKVGVIGLGIIGSRVAENLRNADKHVYVWSRSPKPEPNFLGSPAEIAENADVIQIYVTNGDALLEILGKMKPAVSRRHAVLNHATVDVASTKKAADIVQEASATFLDCPFTGSRDAAAAGELVYYVGGDEQDLKRLTPILEVSAKQILHVGKIGDATVLKIATNMISATTVQVLCEALAICQSQGVSAEKLAQAIEPNACNSGVARMKLGSIAEQNYEPHFTLKNMFKDAQFALGIANDAKIEIPALSSTASMMFKTIQKGHGDEDFSVLFSNYTKD